MAMQQITIQTLKEENISHKQKIRTLELDAARFSRAEAQSQELITRLSATLETSGYNCVSLNKRTENLPLIDSISTDEILQQADALYYQNAVLSQETESILEDLVQDGDMLENDLFEQTNLYRELLNKDALPIPNDSFSQTLLSNLSLEELQKSISRKPATYTYTSKQSSPTNQYETRES